MTQRFSEGSKVRGTYDGIEYSGSVIECRPHTIHLTRIEHTIQLDQPILVYGTVRERIIVATLDQNERNSITA